MFESVLVVAADVSIAEELLAADVALVVIALGIFGSELAVVATGGGGGADFRACTGVALEGVGSVGGGGNETFVVAGEDAVGCCPR